MRIAILLVAFGMPAAVGAIPCAGDCDADGQVTVDELVRCVGMALDGDATAACVVCDGDESGAVMVADLVRAVRAALGECESDPCPLAAGAYTLAPTEGGVMRVATFSPWPVPAGGRLLVDVGPAAAPACRHDVVVPLGGLDLPTSCIPAVNFSVRTVQIGCGVGRIDSNGGADFTLAQAGDSSDSSPICALPDAGACARQVAPDTAARVDVTVGDGSPDVCATGTANLLLSVPVRTTVWLDHSDYACFDPDASFDPAEDALIHAYSYILDLTTDAASARWADLDGDGCAASSGGTPATVSGSCLDLDTGILTTAASVPVPLNTAPYDLLTTLTLPQTLTGPEPPLGVTCPTAPALAVGGTVTRCRE